ncbi:MAG: 3-dehydroquinate synthase [bacterium]|nr:3-dehydroquinate synthase [bacterium]
MQVVNVQIPNNENKTYPIYVGVDAIEKIAETVEMISPKNILVVTNETIYELYFEWLTKAFEKISAKIGYCILPDGEIYKNKTSLETILTCAFENKLERNDAIIAFGGGVIGDIAGFASSIYLRGINFIQIPTTILAQVDSSVGGKVAINTPYGKNLLGAFYQPKAVISDLQVLKTLPKREILTGLSETVKYAFIEKTCGAGFTDFAKYLYANTKDILQLEFEKLAYVVETSCKLKAVVVEQDEKEKGLRSVLNFGHTIGHAIEKCTQYKVFTHGEAVAIGMKAVFMIALNLGKINTEYYDFAVDLLKSYELDFKIPKEVTVAQLADALSFDKKVKDGKVRFVLPVGYAKAEIFDDIDLQVIEGTLKELY